MRKLVLLLFIPFLFSCYPSKNLVSNHKDLLVFEPIKKNIYTHISYLQTETWGKVACNGMVYIHKNKAYVFDTPTDKKGSELLLKILEDHKINVEGVVINHFHKDCLGGLEVFHQKGIKSFASIKTIEAAKKDSVEIPQIGFDSILKIKIGKREMVNAYIGEAHTKDNIVSYLPKEKVLFGGCMVKEVTADKGFLGDANQKTWSNTVRNIKTTFPEIKHVVPGHGKVGGTELLDYTIGLFEVK